MASSFRGKTLKHKLDEALATTSTAKKFRNLHSSVSKSNDSGIGLSVSSKKKSIKPKHGTPKKSVKRRLDTTTTSSDKPGVVDTSNMDVNQILALGEKSQVEDFSELRNDSDSDSNQSDWEEVETKIDVNEPVIPKEGVDITLEGPVISFKRKKKETDLEEEIRRQLKRRQREIQILMHKVHVLSWIAHIKFLNSTLNSQELLAQSLSIVTSKTLYPPKHADLGYLERILKWFKKHISLNENAIDKKCTGGLQNELIYQLSLKVAYNKNSLVFMFVAILRSLGLQARLITSAVVIPLKPTSGDLVNKKKTESKMVDSKKGEELLNDKSQSLPSCSKTNSTSTNNTGKKPVNKKDTQNPPTNSKHSNGKPKCINATKEKEAKQTEAGSKRIVNAQTGSAHSKLCKKKLPDSEDEEFSKHFIDPTRKKIQTKENKLKNKSKSSKTVTSVKTEKENSDDEFSPLVKRIKKIDRSVLSSDEDSKNKSNGKKIGQNYWVEVFLEAEEKWISVDVIKEKVHCVKHLYTRSTQPVVYVIAANNDLTLKDVTKRYVPHWHSDTRKRRVPEVWWEETMWPYLPAPSAREREEDEEIASHLNCMPMPTSIAEYKFHPLYALKRHLLKFEGIYPPDAPPLGYVRKEPVYARECVVTLRSRDIWFKEARIVRANETPYKIVKSRPKYDKMTGDWRKDLPLELFGVWQTEEYIPPNAVDGKVPRNEYGNVDLFKPCMLPGGTVHLQIPAANRVAKKLGIDCAPAIVGFEFHSGGSHPVQDGFVVCEEFKDILLDAWNKEIDESAKRAEEKRDKRVYGNWRRLIRGLLIRENLKVKYAFGENSDEEATTSTQTKKGKATKRKIKNEAKGGTS